MTYVYLPRDDPAWDQRPNRLSVPSVPVRSDLLAALLAMLIAMVLT